MKFRNVEVISYFNTDGTIIQIKIRTTSKDGTSQVYVIKEFNEPKAVSEGYYSHPSLSPRVVSYLDYQCVISVLGEDKVIQLRYWINSHKWDFGVM